MTKWIFNGTLHPLFERRKIEVEAASQLIKGAPTPSRASLRDCSWPSVNSFEIGVHGWPVGGIDFREKRPLVFPTPQIPFTRLANRRRGGGEEGGGGSGKERAEKNRRRRRKRKKRKRKKRKKRKPSGHLTAERGQELSAVLLSAFRSLGINRPSRGNTVVTLWTVAPRYIRLIENEIGGRASWKAELNLIAIPSRRWHGNIPDTREVSSACPASFFAACLRLSDRSFNYFSISEI